jgi:23S rRNA (adenine2503-C2)-methyltransferase
VNRHPINPNLYGLGREALAEALEPLAGEAFRARQVFRALYRRDSLTPGDWSDQPRDLRSAVAASFRIERPRIASRVAAADGTRKFLLDLPDGGRVESVAIPAADRMTFCISSQIGCGFGCEFCMTARMGFVRNLAAGEIVGQVAAMIRETGVEPGRYNIVFMGMGEPLQNLDAVMTALDLLFDEDGFGLGPRRVTVSTVGLPKGILRLASRKTAPRLAVSLVSADQRRRERLMPVARSIHLEDLVRAVKEFGQGRRDRPTLEVVLLKDQNDGESDAKLLADLALRAEAKVNLIEFNPTPELPFLPTTEQRLLRFLAVLSAAGVTGTVRRSRGKDVEAACGQLAIGRHAQDAP